MGLENIVINAQQAMLDGGMIEIFASNVVIGEKTRAQVAPGRYVSLTIKDHGVGMSKEILSKIFDPFFTTSKRRTTLLERFLTLLFPAGWEGRTQLLR